MKILFFFFAAEWKQSSVLSSGMAAKMPELCRSNIYLAVQCPPRLRNF